MKFSQKKGIWPGLLFVVLSFWLSTSCGYQLRGKASFWPPSLKKIYLPVFKNSTGRFQLDVRITEKVINELVARTGVMIVADQDKADGMIQGEILSFKVDPIMVSEGGSASKYKITVVASISFTDFINQTILFHDDNFTFVEEYEVPAGSDFETEETRAIERVAAKFARQLVINLVEGF
ncbi:MAG: LptE family protein [Candidatus Aminicenantes bacterium]|nr:LptE family protein [Candidatus Aminicenantes bacterium]